MNSNGIASQLALQIIAEEMFLPDGTYWLRDQNKDIPNDQGLYIIAGMTLSQPICAVSAMRDAVATDWVYATQTWLIYGQNFNLSGQPCASTGGDLSNMRTFAQLDPAEIEISEVQAREMIQVEILSRSNDALFRNWEIVAALQSINAQQSQETNQFKIGRLPTGFLNTSYAEGAAQLNRYTLTFPAFVWYRKGKIITGDGYYDDFTTRVDDENSISSNVFKYDTAGQEYDQPGETWDEAQPIANFEINQEGISTP